MNTISTSGEHFSQVPKANIERSTFDRTHAHKTTFDAGYLIPVLVDEALPGDTFNVDLTAFARMATPIFPIMDNAKMDIHFFAVPNRLLWNNWEKFNGSQDNPSDSTDYTVPTITDRTINPQTLTDYFGIPQPDLSNNDNDVTFNALHHRAYNLIWNEWYRDQNLQDSVVINKGDGPDKPGDYTLLKRGKRHDYFTSCLPWPQKGEAIPLPGTFDGSITNYVVKNENPITYRRGNSQSSVNFGAEAGTKPAYFETTTPGGGNTFVPVYHTDEFGFNVNSTFEGTDTATINDLRRAFQLQKMAERDARGGTRYTEIIKAHFNVTSPDSRLQRPEYLGGSSQELAVSAIQQTSSTDTTSPQGHLAAQGTITSNNNRFNKSFTEHCVIIGLLSVTADLTYQRALNRMWSRKTRFDYFWPALAHIGEQAVLNKEIYSDGTSDDDKVFGYQERYAEYRYKPSLITGKFRSSVAGNLDSWHLSQNFTKLPTLSAEFIAEDPPFDRVIAVPTEPHFILDTYIKMRCTRPMPVYGIPGMMDRF